MDSMVGFVLLFLLQLLVAALLGLQLGKKRRIINKELEQIAQMKRNIVTAKGGAIYALNGLGVLPDYQTQSNSECR